MKVAVLVKHVPDVQSDRRIEDNRLVRGEDDVINELDENAVEAAVALVENLGGEAIAVTMGPEDAVDAVRRALQMGADRGVHICDERAAGLDAAGTAQVLAAAIQRLGSEGGVDLVIAGMTASDGETSLVPPALAARLGWPVLTVAAAVESDGQQVTIQRISEHVDEQLSAALPAVISVTDQANEPRIPAFKAMMTARKKPVEEWDFDDLGLADFTCTTHVCAAEPVPAREQGTIVTDTGQAGQDLAAYLKQVM